MKLFLVNDEGLLVACLEELERYDGRSPGHVFALLDVLETLLATAKGAGSIGTSGTKMQRERFHV